MTQTSVGNTGERQSKLSGKQPPGYRAGPDDEPLGAAMPARGSVGFMLGHEQFALRDLLQFGIEAERAGFDLIAASDHLQPWQANEGHSSAAWVTLAALSQHVQRAWMGTTVTCPTLRYHPAVVAETFASLSQLRPGRVFLGMGSGEALNEEAATGLWPDWNERWERLAEATQVIRDLWTGEPLQHSGNYYEVDMTLYDAPAERVPILLAANGAKAMRRAGLYGDGLITDPETWEQHRGEFESGAQAAGKELGQMPVLMESFVVVGDRAEAKEAAELWRFIPKAFKGYHDIRDPQEIERLARKEIDLDQIYEQWTISRDPDAHVEKIIELFQNGATIVNIHSGQKDQRRVIEFYGKQVLPQLRQHFELAEGRQLQQ